MAEETTEDHGGTAGATTGGEEMVAGSTATEATEAAGTTTGIGITQEPERKAQETENPEAGGYAGRTFGYRQNGRGYNRGYGRSPTTVTRTAEAVAPAARSHEDG